MPFLSKWWIAQNTAARILTVLGAWLIVLIHSPRHEELMARSQLTTFVFSGFLTFLVILISLMKCSWPRPSWSAQRVFISHSVSVWPGTNVHRFAFVSHFYVRIASMVMAYCLTSGAPHFTEWMAITNRRFCGFSRRTITRQNIWFWLPFCKSERRDLISVPFSLRTLAVNAVIR